jgi:hypothetical protein
MLTAVLKAVKMLLSFCPKNSQDAAVLTALKQSKMLRKTTPTKTKYKDLFPSGPMDEYTYQFSLLLCHCDDLSMPQ